MLRRIGLTAAFFLAALGARGLAPEELLVVANSRCPEGVEVAKQYCAKRLVRDSNLALLPMPLPETVSRREYENDIAAPLRRFIEDHPVLKSGVRCLVTTYGVPLSIGRYDPTPADRRVMAGLSKRLDEKYAALHEQLGLLCGLARTLQTPVPEPLKNVGSAPADAASREDPAAQLRAAQGLLEVLGRRIAPEQGEKPDADIVRRFESVRARLAGPPRAAGEAGGPGRDPGVESLLDEEHGAAEIGSENRDKLYAAREASDGLMGVCRQLAIDLNLVERRDSEASVDSELALLYWKGYNLSRWLPNTLNPAVASRLKPPFPPRVLMVSRLDGPTPQLAAALVDRALEGESRGLRGTFYVDASAAQRGKGGLYKAYDESLERLAAGVREHTSLDVKLDKGGDLFPPGSCPNAALYCGWYSPRQYLDAFAWVPGAVGYHITSFGAQGLRNPAADGWCKEMIEKGAAATLGPVSEPYLHAFPPPEDFFRALLSGKATLAECYYLTNPFNSWRMVLIGDPLYNPFRGHPVVLDRGSAKPGGAGQAGGGPSRAGSE